MSKLINLEDLNEFKSQMINAIYPVGSIYISINSAINPNTLYPGTTWVPFNPDSSNVNQPINIPLNTSVPVITGADSPVSINTNKAALHLADYNSTTGWIFPSSNQQLNVGSADGTLFGDNSSVGTAQRAYMPINLYADLSTRTNNMYLWQRTL